MTVTVADVVDAVESLYPPATAEDWDAVGLAVGSRSGPVAKVMYSVDPTHDTVSEAAAYGADLLVTHHPLYLRGVHGITDDHPKGHVALEILRRKMALYVAHTNADISPGGVVDALATALGLTETRPLRSRPSEPKDKIVAFVPAGHSQAVIDALARAGAGRIGTYDRCGFTSSGVGTFRPLPGSDPYIGHIDEIEQVDETRVEMVLPRSRRDSVVTALLAVHPYDEVAFDLFELASLPSTTTGLGRVGTVSGNLTLGQFAARIAQVLPHTASGVRVSGDLDRPIRTVAVQAGAGDDLLTEARVVGADVYVTSDLRHHLASEARAWPDAPALVDVSHWAAESTWLPVAQRLIAAELATRGLAVESRVSDLCTDPWGHWF